MAPRPAAPSFEAQLRQAWPVERWRGTNVVLAVSAGPDSVALLRAILALKQDVGGSGAVFVGHLNHGLRGQDADADEAWLAELCRRLDVPLKVGRVDATAIAGVKSDGGEAAARDARYRFLRESAERFGARYVATGHTADDQTETVLHRIVRGTGLAGLAGMRAARPLSPSVSLVRPLLGVRRPDVLKYLASLDQDYRTDETNVAGQFTRNRLRHELLPMLRDRFNPNVDDALRRLAVQAREAQQVVEFLATELASQCVETKVPPTRVRIDCRTLVDQPPLLVREVCKTAWRSASWPLQAMGFAEWELLASLVQGDESVSPIHLPGSLRVTRHGGEILIEQLAGFHHTKKEET